MICNTCKREMDESLDRGGDCVFCMAEAGDTDCIFQAYSLIKDELKTLKSAVENLIAVKGRHHTAVAYIKLVQLLRKQRL